VSLKERLGEKYGDVYSAPYDGAMRRRSPVHLPSSGKHPTARQVAQKEKAHAIGCAADVNVHSASATIIFKECQGSKPVSKSVEKPSSTIVKEC
jgi:hypothetical protein